MFSCEKIKLLKPDLFNYRYTRVHGIIGIYGKLYDTVS